MKKLVLILIAFTAITATAQRGHGREMAKLSAEDAATLQTKKMTLALALDESQATKVYQLNLQQAQNRKARKKAGKNRDENTEFSQEDRFKRQNEMLDEKIALQNEMKKILSEEQFKQWRRMAHKRHKRGKGTETERGRRGK